MCSNTISNLQALADKLVGVPWSLKVLSTPGPEAREACYFFKYLSDDSTSQCCFLITDTVNVWAEVLDSKHTSHRARHVHSTRSSSKPKRGFALPYHDADEEAEWRRGVVKTLGEVHEGAMDGIVDVELRESELSDRSVYISDVIRDFHWRWDVMSVRKMAPGILSTQLFMPLVTIATVTSSLGVSTDDASDETLRTHAERKASTAKAMPVHHTRGFFSRPAIQTLLKCIAQVDGAPSASVHTSNNRRNPSLMSVDMTEAPVHNSHKLPDSTSRAPTGGSPGIHGGLGSSRKGKGRDSSTEDEDEGVARKIPRGTTPRRSNIRSTDPDPITPFSKVRPIQADPDSTATEAETTRDWSKSMANTTFNEDEIADHPLSQPSKPPSGSPKPNRSSPRLGEKPKSGRALAPARTPARAPVPDTTDVFGTQTQTQASSDDSDREAELERRIRAAGTIGTAAVRTPAGGGLGSRMIRKKF
ncbi:unnamed protein product [Rhizoctonia solani]|uniref:XLF-like N-terminal domain-containing protein n=1 Tax=Rhizoctonia solani TaxID=456999 RepID=A0A8H3ALC3_9AGAM|nr:unnamed protein product [Rhizoctonia solani]